MFTHLIDFPVIVRKTPNFRVSVVDMLQALTSEFK